MLAVDQTSNQDKNEPVVVRAVTLEMTPKQAEVLVRAREEGRIQLTLRNPTDEARPELVAEPRRAAAAPAPRVATAAAARVRRRRASRSSAARTSTVRPRAR